MPIGADVLAASRFLGALNPGDKVVVVMDGKDYDMTVRESLKQRDFAYENEQLVPAGSIEHSGVHVTFGVGRFSTHISVEQQAAKYGGMAYIKEATS